MKLFYPILALILLATNSQSLLAQQWEIEKITTPKYPIKAIKDSHEDCVKLQFFVNTDGIPVYIEPIKSSTAQLFDAAAVKALAQSRYKATGNNPDKLPERQTIQLTFTISADSDVANKCHANMTSEPSDMESFRQARLSMPIIATNWHHGKALLEK